MHNILSQYYHNNFFESFWYPWQVWVFFWWRYYSFMSDSLFLTGLNFFWNSEWMFTMCLCRYVGQLAGSTTVSSVNLVLLGLPFLYLALSGCQKRISWTISSLCCQVQPANCSLSYSIVSVSFSIPLYTSWFVILSTNLCSLLLSACLYKSHSDCC